MPNQKMHYTYFNIARNYYEIKIVLKTKVGKQKKISLTVYIQ